MIVLYYMLALGKEVTPLSSLSDICKVEFAHIGAMVQCPITLVQCFSVKSQGVNLLGTKDRFFIYEIKSNECFTVLFKVLYL